MFTRATRGLRNLDMKHLDLMNANLFSKCTHMVLRVYVLASKATSNGIERSIRSISYNECQRVSQPYGILAWLNSDQEIYLLYLILKYLGTPSNKHSTEYQ